MTPVDQVPAPTNKNTDMSPSIPESQAQIWLLSLVKRLYRALTRCEYPALREQR